MQQIGRPVWCNVLWSASLYVCLSVCLFVCPLACLKSQKPHIQISAHFLYVLPVAVPRPYSAICYVLPVLWMTSYFHIIEGIGQNQRRRVCFVQFARWRHQSDVRERYLVDITRLRHREWCLPSPDVSCLLLKLHVTKIYMEYMHCSVINLFCTVILRYLA